MGPGPTKDAVLELRAARGTKSISEIMDMLAENSRKTGGPLPCESSVRSVLCGDLDKISGFNQAGTLNPLREVLIPNANQDALLEIIRMQHETIQGLTDQLEAIRETQNAKCAKCEKDMEFYRHQIKLKDNRMERKDRWIAELLKLPKEEEST